MVQDAVIYEMHVKTFCDSDGDGMGDFRGLIEKLDYLQELGITAIWLLPFYPSPLRDDGYDIADYFDVNPNFGTLDDFRAFLDAAHARNLRVITELVINHTSDQNPWFQKSRRAVAAAGAGISNNDLAYKDFYVWSDTPEKYKDSRIIFKDFETSNWAWDPVAKAYYWHRFYSHQPDLNFDNPAVHDAVEKVCDFWLGLGVDGLRLDAIPYLYERENTSCENLPETHAIPPQAPRPHRREISKSHAALGGEPMAGRCSRLLRQRRRIAHGFPFSAHAAHVHGAADGGPLSHHRYPGTDSVDSRQCQWAMFLRNHDELTLEMVTDEERDYMYRVYATDPHARINLGIRRRLAPLLVNSRRKIELLNILLFSMPGTPIIYYGDEIGMGDNFYLGDRNGCRTPMQWSPDRNAGFSRANPQQLYLPVTIDPEYHYEAINVENQQKNLSSLLWWTRRVIAMRKNFKAFSRGSLEFLYPDNPKVLAFLRRYEDETILVVVNLSRFAQSVELDLSRFSGCVPMEVFSRNLFRPIRKSRYVITLGPHAHYWFALHAPTDGRRAPRKKVVPVINAPMELETLLANNTRAAIEGEILPRYLQTCRWFGSKARTFRNLRVVEQSSISEDADGAQLWFVEVNYLDAPAETYVLPVEIASGDAARAISQAAPHAMIARFEGSEESILFDAIWDLKCRSRLFDTIFVASDNEGASSENSSASLPRRSKLISRLDPGNSEVLGAEQSNSSMLFDNKFFLKLYRKLEDGVNPDVEITRFLTEHTKFPNVPAFIGAIEYRRRKAEPTVVCLLQSAVTNEGDVWTLTLDAVGRYYERVLAAKRIFRMKSRPRRVTR